MSRSNDIDDFLAHYGVLGMRWGVRKDALPGVSSRTSREAKKDATEHAKARMFYGDGAGTRRKLINAKVASKSKDASYKKAFDYHSSQQNMAKRASQARGERARKDTKNAVARTARGVKNLALQTGAPVTLGAIAVFAAWKNPAVRSVVTSAAKTTVSTVKNSPLAAMGSDYLKKHLRF